MNSRMEISSESVSKIFEVSYGLKHRVEEDCGGSYVSNGAFIQGAINKGFEVKPDVPNAYFKMKLIKVVRK